MGYRPIEETDVYRRSVELADQLYKFVSKWDLFAKKVVGEQLCRAVDSIGANLVEGDGRSTAPDMLRFLAYARGSAREGRPWLRRALARDLLPTEDAEHSICELTEIVQMINGLIRHRKQFGSEVHERRTSDLRSEDPFALSIP